MKAQVFESSFCGLWGIQLYASIGTIVSIERGNCRMHIVCSEQSECLCWVYSTVSCSYWPVALRIRQLSGRRWCKEWTCVTHQCVCVHTGNYNHIHGTHSSEGERGTGKKGPATAPELGTYALSRSFSHVSHGDQSRSLAISLLSCEFHEYGYN